MPDLRLHAAEVVAGDVFSGSLRCEPCSAEYPIRAGIPYLVSLANLGPAKVHESNARDADSHHYDGTIPPRETRIEMNAILAALRPSRGDDVLDLGAGTGRLTVALARGGAHVIAVDISPKSLEINRQKCIEAGVADRVVHVVADACHLPIVDSTIDKVGSGMMLEHISPAVERQRCIGEIYRVLRHGGRMALTAYNYSWRMSRRRVRREGTHEGGLYYYRFDGAELAGMLATFRRPRVSGILNLPRGLASPALDRLVAAFPALAVRSGMLLFAVASR